MKNFNQETKQFLLASVDALKRELSAKNEEISRKDNLIQFYESKLNVNQPKNEVKVPLHKKYPAAFEPLNEQILS